MVGLVVVSHSRALARAAVALAEEMVHGRRLRIALAAGLDEKTFGTDAVQIMEAIQAADDGTPDGDGVVVLMDLGSAVLSAELALDLLDDDLRSRVLLCPAPLVEGLVVAAVAASGGASRADVAAEASAALAGKQAHFAEPLAAVADPVGSGSPASASSSPADAVGRFTVTNEHGLHARPAARLVQEVRTLDAQVRLRNLTTASGEVPASSLSKVATLGALRGHEVEVRVSGSQAREALDHVLALAARAFDEVPSPGSGRSVDTARADTPRVAPGGVHSGSARGGGGEGTVVPAPGSVVTGMPASPGIGIGPAWTAGSADLAVPDARTDDPAGDWRRLREALATVRREVQRVRIRTAREVGEQDAAIFDAHLLLLDDSDLLGDARSRIESGQAAAPAWAACVARVEADLAALADPYLQARAADVRAVGNQVLRVLLGVSTPTAAGSGVLVAADLTPAEAAELDPDRVGAVVLALGSPTAHSAILARARGIPAVVAAGPGVLAVPEGTVLGVDGDTGEVFVAPDADALEALRGKASRLAASAAQALAGAAGPAVTVDGVQVLVGANVGSAEDARVAAAAGADLAGLVRTEFLFLGRAAPPSVDEQEKAYLELADALGGRRLTLRTLDVGGDKPLGYVPMPPEDNPFLGVRGLRLSLARPALLLDQLRAVMRVAHRTPVSLMFPMVSTLAELLAVRRLLDAVVADEGHGVPAGLQVGIMVEVPAVALKAAAFAPHVDFFSIGTNDLTQYALAAERGNDAVAAIGDPFDPGVLALVDAVCRGAERGAPGDAGSGRGAPLVAVCGELAADPRAAALLVGMGVRELSVSPRAVPAVKHAVRDVDLVVAAALARAALAVAGPDEVRAML